MRRIRLTTRQGLLFGAVFVIALIALLPMRLVLSWIGLGDAGLTARSAEGSVWWGSLTEARFGDLAVGDLNAHLSPFYLLIGRAHVALDRQDGVQPLHGAISISRRSLGLDDITASLSAGAVFAPIPVTGVDLSNVSVRFENGECVRAEGRVKATLSGEVGGIALGQGMSGAAKCDSGALLLPLVSQSGVETANIRLWQAGRFRAEMTVQPVDAAAGAKLVLSGFRPGPRGYVLAVEGAL